MCVVPALKSEIDDVDIIMVAEAVLLTASERPMHHPIEVDFFIIYNNKTQKELPLFLYIPSYAEAKNIEDNFINLESNNSPLLKLLEEDDALFKYGKSLRKNRDNFDLKLSMRPASRSSYSWGVHDINAGEFKNIIPQKALIKDKWPGTDDEIDEKLKKTIGFSRIEFVSTPGLCISSFKFKVKESANVINLLRQGEFIFSFYGPPRAISNIFEKSIKISSESIKEKVIKKLTSTVPIIGITNYNILIYTKSKDTLLDLQSIGNIDSIPIYIDKGALKASGWFFYPINLDFQFFIKSVHRVKRKKK